MRHWVALRGRRATARAALLLAWILGAGASLGEAGGRDPHGPADLEAYIRELEDPQRDEYQKPEEVVRSLALRPSDVVVDLGCGPGYFARRLARAVPQGVVFAVDIEPRQLDRLREHLRAEGLRNVVPVLASPDDPHIPPRTANVVLIVDTYHHLPDRARYLQRLKEILKPGGRLVVIDFYRRELPVGPPPHHKIARGRVLREVEPAGFRLQQEFRFLPYQYFLVFEPNPSGNEAR